jgi:hypothetical protein
MRDYLASDVMRDYLASDVVKAWRAGRRSLSRRLPGIKLAARIKGKLDLREEVRVILHFPRGESFV